MGNSYVVSVDPASLKALSLSNVSDEVPESSTDGDFDALYDVVVPAFSKRTRGDDADTRTRSHSNTRNDMEVKGASGFAVPSVRYPPDSDESGAEAENAFLSQALHGRVSKPYTGFPRPVVLDTDVVTPSKTPEHSAVMSAEGTSAGSPGALTPRDHPSGSLRDIYEQQLKLRGSLSTCPDCKQDPTQHGFCTATGAPHLLPSQCPYCKKAIQDFKFCPVAGICHSEIAGGARVSHLESVQRSRDMTAVSDSHSHQSHHVTFAEAEEVAEPEPEVSVSAASQEGRDTPTPPQSAADAACDPSEAAPMITVTDSSPAVEAAPEPVSYPDPLDGAEVRFHCQNTPMGRRLCYSIDGEERPSFKQMKLQGQKRLFFPDVNKMVDLPDDNRIPTLRKICHMAEWAGVQHDVPDVTLHPASPTTLQRDGSMLYSERTRATTSNDTTASESQSSGELSSEEVPSKDASKDTSQEERVPTELYKASIEKAHKGAWAKRHSTSEGGVAHLRWVVLSGDMGELKWYTRPGDADPRQGLNLASVNALVYAFGSLNSWYREHPSPTSKCPKVPAFTRYKFRLARNPEKSVDFTAADRGAWLGLVLGVQTALSTHRGGEAPMSAGAALWQLACHSYLSLKYTEDGRVSQKYLDFLEREGKEPVYPPPAWRVIASARSTPAQPSLDASQRTVEDSVLSRRGVPSVPSGTPRGPPLPPPRATEVSQPVAQPTPATVEPMSPGKWTCPACTFANHEYAGVCEICTQQRPSATSVTRARKGSPPPGLPGKLPIGRGTPLPRGSVKGQGGTPVVSPGRGRGKGVRFPRE
eukprot:TRINITY_DN27007_c0_g1_i1.p1 TRINITY_DN27007_c0_g1~~TRINITY_DN27007_c0_g1_i1.p1  ORF type:complete len:883 (+),score=68.39 TRINITY_DN27007_c0_g1_i1:215-2650(+)